MILRVRGPNGQATIKVEPSSSVAELQSLLADKTGIRAHEQGILCGFPPRPLQLPEDRASSTVESLGIQAGDSLTMNRVANAPAPAEVAAARVDGDVDVSHFAVEGMSEDEQLARALALSMEDAGEAPPNHNKQQQQQQPQASARSAAAAAAAARAPLAPPPAAPAAPAAAPPSHQHQQPPQQQPKKPRAASPVRSHPPPAAAGRGASNGSGHARPPQPAAGSLPQGAPTSVGLPTGQAVARRIIDSDNSCLFNAVGYVMEGSRAAAPALRRLIAQEVAADPVQWSEVVLDKAPAEYCRWIQQPDKWGGAIELSILSKHYGREIAAFDIQTKRVDIYGQGEGYSERAMVIYDGLHYDALAVAAYPGAPESGDVTVLPSSGARTAEVMAGAAQLAAKAHEARQFTDMANFTLRCGVCQIGLKGEKEAVEHAKKTGHTNFCEY